MQSSIFFNRKNFPNSFEAINPAILPEPDAKPYCANISEPIDGQLISENETKTKFTQPNHSHARKYKPKEDSSVVIFEKIDNLANQLEIDRVDEEIFLLHTLLKEILSNKALLLILINIDLACIKSINERIDRLNNQIALRQEVVIENVTHYLNSKKSNRKFYLVRESEEEFKKVKTLQNELLKYLKEKHSEKNDKITPIESQEILSAMMHEAKTARSQNSLNAIIPEGLYKGESVVFALARDSEGIKILGLMQEAKMTISQHTLNTISTQGQFKGQSVAFWLAAHPQGQKILLTLMQDAKTTISQDTLNTIIPEGTLRGLSVAFGLAGGPDGRKLLELMQEAKITISQHTLNVIFPGELYRGRSVAFGLAPNPEGRKILLALMQQGKATISQDTLNTIIPEGSCKGLSVAFGLAGGPEGRKLLELMQEAKITISQHTLNATIPAGPGQGQSVSLRLAANPEGNMILQKLQADTAIPMEDQSNHKPNGMSPSASSNPKPKQITLAQLKILKEHLGRANKNRIDMFYANQDLITSEPRIQKIYQFIENDRSARELGLHLLLPDQWNAQDSPTQSSLSEFTAAPMDTASDEQMTAHQQPSQQKRLQ
jgi:hypothetical protein